MDSEKPKNNYEKWRQFRRNEWSIYKGEYITDDILNKFQRITGLNDDIIKYNNNTPLQLWIDNIVDRLINKYNKIKHTLPLNEKYSTILILIGFKDEFINKYNKIDDGITSHFTLDQIIETIIDDILYNI